MKTHAKHMSMDVMRPASGQDCTLGGLSSKVTQVEIVAEITEQESHLPAIRKALADPSFRQMGGAGAVVLVTRPGTIYPPYLAPLQAIINGAWCMFGGNLAHTSNGVVTDVTKSRVLSIHDRHETAGALNGN